MKISSPAFNNNDYIPPVYTCADKNINPPLVFDDLPGETKSLVLMVEDTDADPEPWVHWLVFNIPPTILSVSEDSIPDGSQEGHANGGTPGYEGPCQKYFSGIHHYRFRLYALDTVLDLPPTADKQAVIPSMEGHILEEAELTGLCEGTSDKRSEDA